MSALLEVSGLTKVFGGFTALQDVSLSVAPGSIHAVIGPNGAGKSTLFRLVAGVYSPTRGEVRLAGRNMTGMRAHQVARNGLVQVFQITNVFPRLTVIESVRMALLAGQRRAGRIWRRPDSQLTQQAESLIAEVGLEELADVQALALSHGDQRALEVALALGAAPTVLLLDEPTAGMSPFETQRMIALVRKLKASRGLTIMLSEHDMDVIFSVSDLVTVLHRGQVISEGKPEQVSTDEQVLSVYLGGERR